MKKRRIYLILILAVLLTVIIGILVINKKIKIAPVLADRFEVTGVDVSHYQGMIDWQRLASQDLDFAFIKATEGSGHTDECFYDNWQEAEKTDLYIGAYHFFSFDSEGRKQAQLYIDTVGSLNGKLAPVVDVEFYGDKEENPPPKDEVVRQLREMLEALEERYQVKPVIYTTYHAYDYYIKDAFTAYPLWIRNVYYRPLLIAGNTWTFWQYTDTAVLEGYHGSEKYIDMNVFRGTKEELQKLTVQCESEESLVEEDELKEPESFLLGNGKTGTEEEILLEHCNLVYDTEQIKVYSYLGMNTALYILTPEREVIYPVRNFWMDQERAALWVLEDKEDIRLREIDLAQEHFLKETLVLDLNGFETLIADTYGLFRQGDQVSFGNLYVDLFCRKENGELFLGGRVSGIYQQTNQIFEIVYEIDRESGTVSAKGYLQDLEIAPLYQEFLLHNLTVECPSAKGMELGHDVSFFDDEIYLSEMGTFCKQFAMVKSSENGGQELLFRMSQTDGEEEWIYVLTEEKGELICRDVLKMDSTDDSEDKNEASVYVCAPWARSNGCKSRTCPGSGKCIAEQQGCPL